MSDIVSYDRNPDGTIRFIDENGQTVLNAPGDNPMTLAKIDEIQNKWSPAGVQRPAPSYGVSMGTVGQQGGYVSPLGQYVPPPPSQTGTAEKSKPYQQPFGQGSSAAGFQGSASRGIHSIANLIGGRILADREKAEREKEKAPDPYNRMTELAGQSGVPMDPAERKAYEDAHARMAAARAEEARALQAPPPAAPVTPVRQPGPGEMIDPATGAVIPWHQSDDELKKEAEREGA